MLRNPTASSVSFFFLWIYHFLFFVLFFVWRFLGVCACRLLLRDFCTYLSLSVSHSHSLVTPSLSHVSFSGIKHSCTGDNHFRTTTSRLTMSELYTCSSVMKLLVLMCIMRRLIRSSSVAVVAAQPPIHAPWHWRRATRLIKFSKISSLVFSPCTVTI